MAKRIEKIEKSKHKQERILVYLEGGDLLRITQDELLQFGVRPGMDLSDELVLQLKEAGHHSEVKVQAAHLASGRMLSKKEIRQKLQRKGASETEAQDAADWLENIGAVNDQAYAGTIVRHYVRTGYGLQRIRMEFMKRGIPREQWDEAIEENYIHVDEAIADFIRSKLRGQQLTTENTKKISDALLRRGYSWNEIRPVLNALGTEIFEDI